MFPYYKPVWKLYAQYTGFVPPSSTEQLLSLPLPILALPLARGTFIHLLHCQPELFVHRFNFFKAVLEEDSSSSTSAMALEVASVPVSI